MPVTAEDVLQVLDTLANANIPAWLDGGWGVDALVGKQTREHDDLDLVIPWNVFPSTGAFVIPSGVEGSQPDSSTPLRFGRNDDAHRSTLNDTAPLRNKCEAALAPHGFILYKDELPASFVLRATSAGDGRVRGSLETPNSKLQTPETDRRVDIHPVKFDQEGNAHQTALSPPLVSPEMRGGLGGEKTDSQPQVFMYPKEGFTGKGAINGREVPCLTAEVQILCHDGYQLDANDIADMQLLSDHFNIPLPDRFNK